ncbi:PadR family transcriptional regulator [Candidatus Xianfuyuplasma coldseepsis]|uniref:Helix-turn-helix transcriptional regulator n=1 Tax=Candidatus Xianfuyuplasma coldseepsis TaxID=2782163 RepID=A0A7L7KU38_9MOLU|nr:PadR family transcriptional regulator [Xianfuyuplasma coldseepsis]QMS85288.1 helix-turn-helix transcriptional regulator [Xianfuyuplasma coldseepsis]
MTKFKQQFKKGLLELVILKLLCEKDHYGYSLIQEVNTRTNNSLELKEGTLYPLMHRLENQELIKSYWSRSKKGRENPRKYYQIMPRGRKKYVQMYLDYKEIIINISDVLNG